MMLRTITPSQLVDVLGTDYGERAAALLGVTASGTFEAGVSTLQLRTDPDEKKRKAAADALGGLRALSPACFEATRYRIVEPAPALAASLAFQAVVVAFVSYLVWFWLLRRYPATVMSSFTFLTPVFALLLGVGLLGEPLTLQLRRARVDGELRLILVFSEVQGTS